MADKVLKVIPKKCIACGACTSICPESFTLDMDDPEAFAIATNPPKNSDEDIVMAVKSCPTGAIVYKEES